MRHSLGITLFAIATLIACLTYKPSDAEARPPWRCYTCSIQYASATFKAGEYSTSKGAAKQMLIDFMTYFFTQGGGTNMPQPQPSIAAWALANMTCSYTPKFLDGTGIMCLLDADVSPLPYEPAPVCEPHEVEPVGQCTIPEYVAIRMAGDELCTAWLDEPYADFYTGTAEQIDDKARSLEAAVDWSRAYCDIYDRPYDR